MSAGLRRNRNAVSKVVAHCCSPLRDSRCVSLVVGLHVVRFGARLVCLWVWRGRFGEKVLWGEMQRRWLSVVACLSTGEVNPRSHPPVKRRCHPKDGRLAASLVRFERRYEVVSRYCKRADISRVRRRSRTAHPPAGWRFVADPGRSSPSQSGQFARYDDALTVVRQFRQTYDARSIEYSLEVVCVKPYHG